MKYLAILILAAALLANTLVATGANAAQAIAAPTVRIANGKFVNADGKPVLLRGANISGLEFAAIQGWSPNNPWGMPAPDWQQFRDEWNFNTVRIPLNQASWLELTTTDADGKKRNADPGDNYRATVIQSVKDATAAGLYVILDLHWSNPFHATPKAQNMFADKPDSIRFWSDIATTFKAYPNVIYDLFNEPVVGWVLQFPPSTPEPDKTPLVWKAMRDGGTATRYYNDQLKWTAREWSLAGFQEMLDAIRATGSTQVVLVAGNTWAQDMSLWLEYKVSDPLGQLGASWHAYPVDVPYDSPKGGDTNFEGAWSDVDKIVAAGFPVVITETGDFNQPQHVGSRLVSRVLATVDRLGASAGVTPWTWNKWGDPKNVLLNPATGGPNGGFAKVYYDWSRSKPRP